VAQVSRPSVHVVLGGREAARGYRLKGVGAIFVLPPRALPRPASERDRVLFVGPSGPLTMVRRRRAQDRELREVEIQVETLQREAEAAQREAMRAFDEFEQNLRRRLPPEAPAPPEPPAAPAAPVGAGEAPGFPQPPPWRFWFEEEPADDRTPDRVIADVQAALTAALEDVGPRLRVLAADEAVLVAVDFLPFRAFDFAPPSAETRSLILKAKKRDLVDRSQGKIGREELLRRIEVTQY
jgi:hypothetical protein